MKEEPYWWEHARPRAVETPELPARTDVAVIGSGYTGLSAALTLARAGRSVLVLEAGIPGVGASSRNGGMLGHALKPSLEHADATLRREARQGNVDRSSGRRTISSAASSLKKTSNATMLRPVPSRGS